MPSNWKMYQRNKEWIVILGKCEIISEKKFTKDDIVYNIIMR